MAEALTYVAGEVEVSEQLLSNERRDGQLRFEGSKIFEPPSFDGILKHYFINEIREDMNRAPLIAMFREPHYEELRLFELPDRADAMETLFESVLAGRVPLWVYENLEEELRRAWDD